MAEISVRFTIGKERCLMNLLKKASAALLCSVLVLTAFPAAISADDDPSEEASAQDVYVSDIPYDDIAFDDDDFDEAEGFGETEIISRTVENGVERTAYTINWTIPANSSRKGTIQMSLTLDDIMIYSLNFSSIPSNGNIMVGLYYPASTDYIKEVVTETTYKKNKPVSKNGTCLVKIQNDTNTEITVKGNYESVVFRGGAIDVPLYAQENSKWCWAACTQMCASRLGYNKYTQKDIVFAVKNSYDNLGANAADYPVAMKFATENAYTAVRETKVLTSSSIKSILLNNMPVMIVLDLSSTQHANVVTAVDKDNKYLKANDPANGGSHKIYKYSDLTASNSIKKYIATVEISRNN